MENKTGVYNSLDERTDSRMDGQYFWKRTEDAQIDLLELLCRLCGRWKQIAVCAAVAALLLGAYGWLGHGNAAREGEVLQKEPELTEEEEQAVADAVSLENEIRELEIYLDHSLLMQIEPYHKNKSVMLYCIDNAKRQELAQITESYLSFVINGGVADALTDSGSSNRWKTDKIYLSEVISAYQKTYSSPYQIVLDSQTDSGQTAESLFYVETVAKDAKEAQKLALDVQDALKQYTARVKKTAGSHRLRLISSQKSVTPDSGLQAQQHEKKAQLSANKTSLKSLTDAFNDGQMEVYRKSAGAKEEEDRSGENEAGSNASGAGFRSAIKYALLGMIAGIFAYCGVYACWYIFRDTVKSTEEMKRLYTFPVYGEIELEGRKKRKKTADVPKSTYADTQLQVLNRIRLACRKQGVEKFCAASDFPLSMPERQCLERMSDQLKEWGIGMAVAENVSADPAMWDGLAETGNVLLVCRMGMTTHRMIDDVMEFYLLNGVHVAGAAVFGESR